MYRIPVYMQIFLSFALEAKSVMRIYPHPTWEGLTVEGQSATQNSISDQLAPVWKYHLKHGSALPYEFRIYKQMFKN